MILNSKQRSTLFRWLNRDFNSNGDPILAPDSSYQDSKAYMALGKSQLGEQVEIMPINTTKNDYKRFYYCKMG